MKILVTGGGGFVGSHLVRRLVARGNEVRVLGRRPYPFLDEIGVEQVRGDLRDSAAVKRAVGGVEGVFHTAAKVGYWGAYEEFYATNVIGTQNLIDACRAADVRHLVYTSTPSAVIGSRSIEGGDETTPYPKRHLFHYGSTKAEAERRMLAANGDDGLATAALRPHLIFGPGDPHIVPRILESARRGALAQIGDGSNKVDVTYIDNCVDAHLQLYDALAAGKDEVRGQAYFIGQEEPVELWAFINRILEGFGEPRVRKRVPFATAYGIGAMIEGVYRALRLSSEPRLSRMAAVSLGRSHYFSHAKAQQHFGYAPRVNTEEGLRHLFQADRARFCLR